MFQWLLHVCLISIELSVLVPQETTSTLKLKHTSYHHTIDLQAMAIWFRAKWKLEQTHSSGQLLMCFPEACSDWNATSITCVWKPRQQKSQFRPIRWHVICQHWPPEADLRTRTASIRFFFHKNRTLQRSGVNQNNNIDDQRFLFNDQAINWYQIGAAWLKSTKAFGFPNKSSQPWPGPSKGLEERGKVVVFVGNFMIRSG